jgi:hypothetical protein
MLSDDVPAPPATGSEVRGADAGLGDFDGEDAARVPGSLTVAGAPAGVFVDFGAFCSRDERELPRVPESILGVATRHTIKPSANTAASGHHRRSIEGWIFE